MTQAARNRAAGEFGEARRACTAHFLFATAFTVLINVLAFTYPIFMIQVYDRVISSRSVETLIALLAGVTLAFLFRAMFEWTRSQLLIRAAVRIDNRLSERVFGALIERSGSLRRDTGSQALRDLDTVKRFTTGRGALAVMDAPWVGLFVGVMFLMDAVIGYTALACISIMVVLILLNAIITKKANIEGERATNLSYQFAEANLRSADAILAMGMMPGVVARWRVWRDQALRAQVSGSQRSGAISAMLDSARLWSQAIILSAGVIQVMRADVPFGIAFASVILFGFAMRPVQTMISAWEGYQQSSDALRRLTVLLADAPLRPEAMPLPRPSGQITCENVLYAPPGSERTIIRNVNLRLEAGTTLGVFGPIGSGKTTLVRLLVGILRPTRGSIRLDGAEIWSWPHEDLGRYMGYLPQEISLLSGSVAENIGRFGQFGEAEIVEAAQRARVHDIILALPRGYDTPIGEGGHPVSGGQRQLIGLARAVVGTPALVVLDEPNSNLDGAGESALMSCIQSLKAAGTTVIMVSHRPNLVRDLDQLAAVSDGTIMSTGPTKAVLERMRRPMIVEATPPAAEQGAKP